ncbi:MAG: polyphosphate kinase 2 [Rhizomicrobium sp.]|jgi:polyphosphate kinase 2
MSKKKHSHDDDDADEHYHRALRDLQIELVKLQRTLIGKGSRVLVIFEGRDASGKDGAIRRLTEHMSPRETRIHAPGKPSDREDTEWYFQRFVPELPAGGEFVVFNRSWYNRAGVERVMGFCRESDVEEFFVSVVPFEEMLIRSGIAIRKFYLDVSKDEQKKRLKDRETDPLKQWKVSPVDEAALKNWKAYSKARDEMFVRTSHPMANWTVINADVKKTARLEMIRTLLASFSYDGKSAKLAKPDASIAFPWSEDARKKIHE